MTAPACVLLSLIATVPYLLKDESENLPHAQQVFSSFVLLFIYLLGLAS